MNDALSTTKEEKFKKTPGPARIETPLAKAVLVASPGTVAAPIAVPAAPEPVTVYVDYEEYDSSDDEDATNAAKALANDSRLLHYHGTYLNVLVDASSPLYYVIRGHYISIFSGWDATSPKVLGVSHTIFHKVDCVEQGINIMKGTIDHGDASQYTSFDPNVFQDKYHTTKTVSFVT
ncbi:hypothetical protein BDR03DRAFT_984965 [Suillus americanus]|nr:hypothetical protein BDR03DRAFT_984965 [Suillus americanus]